MTFYAKSPLPDGRQVTVKEHCEKVAELAGRYASEFEREKDGKLSGIIHDFGKNSESFESVLHGTRHGIDHAVCGAAILYDRLCHFLWSEHNPNIKNPEEKLRRYVPVMEVINGHHDGLVDWSLLRPRLEESLLSERPVVNEAGKTAALAGAAQYQAAWKCFKEDWKEWKIPKLEKPPQGSSVARMLYTRMLFSSLVDADYSVSASDETPDYLTETEVPFDPDAVLRALYAYHDELCAHSDQNTPVNRLRGELFRLCGEAGESNEGLFTLTAPTGTGKTLALLHFALRQCVRFHKKRVIIVLPYLSITEQNADVYRKIEPALLEDHSQSELSDAAREFAARWSVPLIVTTSVRFFESLFSAKPGDCRKLHHLANSVIVFDEAQSLPSNVMAATLQAVNELCTSYHATMLFSTATQPDYSALKQVPWQPTEIVSEPERMYRAMRRTTVEWRIAEHARTPLCAIAQEMSGERSVCAIVNLRAHARKLFCLLNEACSEEEVFYLTTDLCPADRRRITTTIRNRLAREETCRVVATQCIEAGVDFDFEAVYRALAPLDAIVQAAGRCNRNGKRPLGRVVVFVPDEEEPLYPGTWYEQAALKVEALAHRAAIDIHDPEQLRAYYRLLFRDAQDKKALCEALEERDYARVAREYKLIENRGIRIIVPAKPDIGELSYEAIRDRALQEGMTPALMRAASSITVSCFRDKAGRLDEYLESIPLARRRDRQREESGFYLLRPQYERLYDARMGLQLHDAQSSPDDYIISSKQTEVI